MNIRGITRYGRVCHRNSSGPPEKVRQQVIVKGWVNEHIGEMRKVWSDHIIVYKEQIDMFKKEEEEFLGVKKASLVEGAAKGTEEVKADSRKALDTCKDNVFKNLGQNEETKQALQSLVMMKEAVNASATQQVDTLGALMGKVEGVIEGVKRGEEEERVRRETLLQQEREQQQGGAE